MLFCRLVLDHSSVVATVAVRELRDQSSTLSDYHVNITVDRGPEIGHYAFMIYREPSHYRDSIRLLRLALNLIPTSTDTITIDGEVARDDEHKDITPFGTSALEWEVRRALPTVPGKGTREVCDN